MRSGLLSQPAPRCPSAEGPGTSLTLHLVPFSALWFNSFKNLVVALGVRLLSISLVKSQSIAPCLSSTDLLKEGLRGPAFKKRV